MTNVRVITNADRSTKLLGRSAVEWRNDFALAYFAGLIAAQQLQPVAMTKGSSSFGMKTQNKKAPKPVFEVHEREIGPREYELKLMRRNNANKLTEVGRARVGMFGKLLDKPARKAPADMHAASNKLIANAIANDPELAKLASA